MERCLPYLPFSLCFFRPSELQLHTESLFTQVTRPYGVMVLAGKDAIFVEEGGWDSWAELRFPSSLLPDVMLKLAVDCPCVLCNFSQKFFGCFKANFADFVCALLILIVTAILQPSPTLA